jgi:hypothetical protein
MAWLSVWTVEARLASFTWPKVVEIFIRVLAELRGAHQHREEPLAAIDAEFLHSGLGLRRGCSADKGNPTDRFVARILVLQTELGVMATIPDPKSSDWLLAFIEDPLIPCARMLRVRNAMSVGLGGGAGRGVAGIHSPDLAQKAAHGQQRQGNTDASR